MSNAEAYLVKAALIAAETIGGKTLDKRERLFAVQSYTDGVSVEACGDMIADKREAQLEADQKAGVVA